MEKKEIIIIILLFIVIGFLIYMFNNFSSNMEIYFFNAGKADAILVSHNNHYFMIDTGEESLKEEILDYFKENNITKLDYLIITHFDKDHVGSASHIINNIEIGEVLQSNTTKDSEYYKKYLQALQNKKIIPKTILGDYLISLDNLKICVNGPDKIYESNESNNSSLIVSITNYYNNFLFMGDSENARIKDYLNDHREVYDFVKIPYHGHTLKRLDDLLEVVKPTYAVITCSNSSGASKETLELLKEYHVNYYLTKNGSVMVFSDGKSIQIRYI